MTVPKIVLHEWRISPFCNKVRQILAHKNLAYETVRYNGLEARRAASLTEVGKLPVIDLDGERIADSAAIAHALEARFPDPPLFPADPRDRARAHFWESWAGEALYPFEVYYRFAEPEARAKALDALCEGRPGWERALLAAVLPGRYRRKLREVGLGRMPVADVDARLKGHLDALVVLLEGAPWLAGAERCVADLAVAAQLQELIRTSRPGPWVLERAPLVDWLARTDAAGLDEVRKAAGGEVGGAGAGPEEGGA